MEYMDQLIKLSEVGGGALPYSIHPLFWHFSDPIGSPFYAQLDIIDPLFLQKESVCLY